MAEYSAAWTAETVPPPSSDVLDAVRASLTHLPLRAILPRRQHIVTVEHSQTVADALDTFAHHVIVSAPVLVAPGLEDLEEEAAAGGAGAAAAGDYPSSALSRLHSAYFGYLDIAGILRALLEHLRRKHGGRIPTSMLTLMSELEEEGAVFGQRAVVSIMSGAEDRALLFEADAGMTLLEAIKDVFLGGGGGGGGGSDGSKPSIAAATSLGRVPTSTTATAKQQQQVVHRLAVFEEHGDITHIVSQLDVVRWLHVQMEAAAAAAAAARTAAAGGGGGGFGGSSQPTAQTHSSAATAGAAAASGGSLCGGAFPAASQQQALSLLGARSLIDLGLLTGKPPVVSVDPNLLTLLAYERMLAAGVSGAAVVHPDTGRLIANLSVSDLRSMRAAHFGCLALPVAEFLAHLHQAVYLGYYYPHQQPGTTSRDDGGSGQHGGGRRNEFFADAAAARRSRQTSSSGMAAAGASHHKVAPGAAVGGAASPALGEGSSSHALRRIVCWPDSSLRHVLSLLADNHVHRVYVCPVSSSGGRQQQQRSANSAAAAWGHRNDGISGGGWQGAAAAADLTSSSLIPQAVITPTDILRLLAGVW